MEGFAALACSGTDENDVASALLLHLGDGVLDEAEDAVKIYSDGAMPLLIGQAIDGRILGRPDAVIGDEDVESAPGGDCRRDQILRARRGRKIALNGAAILGSTFANQIFGLGLRRLVVENDSCSGGDEHANRGRADAARASGDKSDFGLKSENHTNHCKDGAAAR